MEEAKKEKELREKLRHIKRLMKSNASYRNDKPEKTVPEIGSQDILSASLLPSRIASLYEEITKEAKTQIEEENESEKECSSSSESAITEEEEEDRHKIGVQKKETSITIPVVPKKHKKPRRMTNIQKTLYLIRINGNRYCGKMKNLKLQYLLFKLVE